MHIHILGIAGSMTAPLALALQKQGHTITGSDQEKIYPPFSQQLKKAKISVNKISINSQIDLAIIGSSYLSFEKTRNEFNEIKSKSISYISATNYISQNLVKKNSILVAGSYGKTTITTAIVHLLKTINFDPAYMFGGQSLNYSESLHFSNSDWSVIEADESINGLDTQAKFLNYQVKYLVLTSVQWEHKDSYQSEEENFSAFKKLVENIPQDGLLIYNQNDSSILPLLPLAKCKKIPYQSTKLNNNLLGNYNQNNLGAVETLAKNLNISDQQIQKSFSTFKGVKRRLEIIANTKNIIFIDDFAQSASRIKAALQAIKDTYPHSRLLVFYEAHASFMQYHLNLNELSLAFLNASEIIISRLKFSSKIKPNNRITAKDFLNTIPNSLYLPIASDIIKHYQNTLRPNDILIHFSSGGSEGQKIFKEIISLYSK